MTINWAPATKDAPVTDPSLAASEIALLKGLLKMFQGGAGVPTAKVSLTESTVQVPMDLQSVDVRATFKQFTALNIRDTNKGWLGTNQDWSMHGRMVLRVDNGLNQEVALFVGQQGQGDFQKADGTGRNEIKIPAGASKVLITPNEWPILGETIAELVAFGAQCAVAPTSGTLRVDAYIRPII